MSSGKKAKQERTAEAAATVANDPGALWKAQVGLVRLDGAIEGLEKAVAVVEGAVNGVREAIGDAKANRRKLLAEVERMQKAAGIDGKTKPPADGAAAPEATAPAPA